MSRSLLILSVMLAAYAVLSTVGAAVLAASWRAGLIPRGRCRPDARARGLAWMRAAPSLGAAGLTAGKRGRQYQATRDQNNTELYQ